MDSACELYPQLSCQGLLKSLGWPQHQSSSLGAMWPKHTQTCQGFLDIQLPSTKLQCCCEFSLLMQNSTNTMAEYLEMLKICPEEISWWKQRKFSPCNPRWSNSWGGRSCSHLHSRDTTGSWFPIDDELSHHGSTQWRFPSSWWATNLSRQADNDPHSGRPLASWRLNCSCGTDPSPNHHRFGNPRELGMLQLMSSILSCPPLSVLSSSGDLKSQSLKHPMVRLQTSWTNQ